MKNFKILLSLFCFNLIGYPQNLISNGDFESGCTNWWNGVSGGGNATFTCPVTGAGNVYAGVNALRANIVAPGANAWDVQTIHSGITVTTGLTHTLTFWAKVTAGPRSVRIVIQNTTYTAQDFNITSTWNQYTFNFTPTETSLQVKIHYTNAGDFFFDNFTINDPSGGPAPVTSIINPATTFQQMVGFGGALTWYCDRITSSPNKNAICDLMFIDLGLDILRLKNWYYPANYPTDKSTTTMNPSWFKPHFDATNQLYTEAKSRNPNIEVLLCSWSPPQWLKSNNALPEGTLRQNAGAFMYKEFAQYWVDILDRISFTPDYISLQNEPGYVNPGWETCEWRPTQTATLPGLDIAHDSVWQRIKNRPNVPKILAPEPENLGAALWNPSLNTFREFANPLKNKTYIHGYNYHLYNYAGSAASIAPANLNIVRDEFNNKPNFMTEFSSSNYTWLDAARMIHANLVEANTSAYIYWELMWDENNHEAMIQVNSSGAYTVLPYYYTIKHYAKYIDKGYRRIAASGSNATLNITAFINPAQNQITVVAINNHVSAQPLTLSLSSASATSAFAYQSVAGNYWQNLGSINLSSTQNLPPKSLTTYVININPLPIELLYFTGEPSEEGINLYWGTTHQSEPHDYVLERMEESRYSESSRKIVARIPSVKSSQPADYHFLDSAVYAQNYYYKLHAVYEDGNTHNLGTVHVYHSGKDEKKLMLLYPNPCMQGKDFYVKFNQTSNNDNIYLKVMNNRGEIIDERIAEAGEIMAMGKNYHSGLYFVQVRSGHKVATAKIMIE
ncbi:MAG: carbohydrate binding domain-containing protein [Cytophagaceae bacterium]|nr:carbohydrate binding domain-containing protein [Cytophagaceae bacterium]MDW8456297.1 carbohydrate binding domain-containing protein [Cytophagaceae bacterium]